MRYFLLFLMLFSVGMAEELSLWKILDLEGQIRYGKEYTAQKQSLSLKPDFSLFKEEIMGGKEIETKTKDAPFKKVRVPDEQKLFAYLKNLSEATTGTLPDYYAFLLSRIAKLDKNKDFNTRYGTYFASKLMRHNQCEGYYWHALILSQTKQEWEKSLDAFKKASSLCEEKYAYKSRLHAARMKYLVSQQHKKEQK